MEGGDTVDVAVELLELVLAGVVVGGDVGVEGAVDTVCSDVLGAGSFLSPVVGSDAPSLGDGFSLSE